MKIAVIGSGISGLSAAWLLSQRHDVTLLEQGSYFGGHSNTVDVRVAEGKIPVDTGFIVYNKQNYPNLVALFNRLDVPTKETSMSFAVSLNNGGYEYSSSGLVGYFGQKRNLLRPYHWRMAKDIMRFFKEAREFAKRPSTDNMSLGGWLKASGYGQDFISRHILPMGSAIWSTPPEDMLKFPAASFARFLSNHGLLQAYDQPFWRTVRGGSREYVSRLLADFKGQALKNKRVLGVHRENDAVRLRLDGGTPVTFDYVVLACHGDQALKLLSDVDAQEHAHLSPFHYSDNLAILHTDASQMPRRRRLWSSWNFTGECPNGAVCVTYWMNKLQPLETSQNVFVTLNPVREIAEEKVIERFQYRHPVFDTAAIAAQHKFWQLQGYRRTWYAGSYLGYGFHEDGLQAGLAVAEQLGGQKRPWEVENSSSRIHVHKVRVSRQLVEAA